MNKVTNVGLNLINRTVENNKNLKVEFRARIVLDVLRFVAEHSSSGLP